MIAARNTSPAIRASFLSALLVLTIVLGWPASRAVAATPQQVEESIQKAKAFLWSLQGPDGSWEAVAAPELTGDDQWSRVTCTQWGGMTALATYTLLSAGESHQDPRIKKALDFLRSAKLTGTYALAVRCQVWSVVPQTREFREAAKRDMNALLAAQYKEGENRGFYTYYLDLNEKTKAGWYDHSVSQLAVLGMWACAQQDLEVPQTFWLSVDKAWREHQYEDGSWAYVFKSRKNDWGNGRPALTAAGVATLFITQDYLNRSKPADCHGNITDPAIEKGLEWMTQNFAKVFDEGQHLHYALYGVERIGVASGRKYFGTTDWYAQGSNMLVKDQNANGSWGKPDRVERWGYNPRGLPDTCFGMIFLVRGRAPVVLNKLQYEINRGGDKPIPANWNERPRDAANFVHWFTKESDGRPMNWQIVNLKVKPEELHDAPLLYITGNQALSFTAEEIGKLRAYIEQGGMIVANADCASAMFLTSFRQLAATMFPKYELRELPADHPIYTGQQYPRANWKGSPPKVLALGNGARELMIVIPEADFSRSWQMMGYLGREPNFQLVANIFLYAVEKRNLRFKGETYIVQRDDKVVATRKLKVARLEYDGNWDPEPGGWRRLASFLHNQNTTDIEVETVKLGAGKLDKTYAMAHLTGTGKFALTPAQGEELKKYVDAGGLLLMDACGGGTDFTASAEPMLMSTFGSVPAVLAAKHALYAAPNKIEAVGYRAFSRKVMGNLRVPQLRGIEQNGRLAVILSREDLSVGMVGMRVDGVNGYVPLTSRDAQANETVSGADALMANIVAYAAAPPATTQPAKGAGGR